jgi:hypothetical protein
MLGILGTLLLFIFSLSASAAVNRVDYDLDNDGLIEVNDWADLNEIRNNLSGTSIYGNSAGCPATGCNGFELTADLDFDTNGDGLLDASDAYWNGGAGWVAIGTSSTPFTATFEGNGHVIRNLMIKRYDSRYQGLFGYTLNANLRNLGLKGQWTYIVGENYVGGLAGAALTSSISGCYFIGVVKGVRGDSGLGGTGGLVGYGAGSSIVASFSTGSVSANGGYIGGLVGAGAKLRAVFSTAKVSGFEVVGGLMGAEGGITSSYATGKVTVNPQWQAGGLVGDRGGVLNSYWARDSTGQDSPSYGTAVSLAQLQCPTAADDIRCANGTILYQGWGDLKDANGNAYWDFGTATQLPGLVINGVVYRDSDSDGLIDQDDADDDNDGAPDVMDAFASNAAASVDVDADGHPDAWTANCDAICQAASRLVLDHFPNNAAASVDADSDGKPDAWNASCFSACQTSSGLVLDTHLNDTDNDGVANVDTVNNNADANSNGLIEVSNWAQLDAIRHNLRGTGRQMTDGGFIDSSGCPPRLVDGVVEPACFGYELTTDLDFDTNGDGLLDASDAYWNGGGGWRPIGNKTYTYNKITTHTPFTATFDGNGHVIHNLMIKGGNVLGLFGTTQNATVRNLGLKGKLMSISSGGGKMVGGLVGDAQNSVISGCFSAGAIRGDTNVGGLIGHARSGSITASFSAGSVLGFTHGVGGLVGQADGTNTLAVFSTATVSAYNEVGGLIGLGGATLAAYATGKVTASASNLWSIGGLAGDNGAFTNSYWATDTTGQLSNGESIYDNRNTDSTGVTLAQLQCPTEADNTSCVGGTTLYKGWGDLKDADGNAYWDFGTDTQLPGLVIKGVVYRDNDGDGFLDMDDAWPNDNAASQDTDGDGFPDTWNAACDATCQTNSSLALDALPTKTAASVDTDGDGSPDNWNTSCDLTCQTNSGLVLDAFPTNPAASLDSDSDGRPDIWNTSCSHPVCQTASGLTLDKLTNDSDNDGLVDSLDSDNTQDGGKPTIMVVPQDLKLPATGATTAVTLAFANIVAFDEVDPSLTFKVYLGDDQLLPNAWNRVFLPSGSLKLKWVAFDDAGNASEPVEQLVDIYPIIQFTQVTQTSVEPSIAKLAIGFSGDLPEYPVHIQFSVIRDASTANDADIDGGTDLTKLALTINNANELATAALNIPVVQDSVFEGDEVLTIEIASATAGKGQPFALPREQSKQRTQLTIVGSSSSSSGSSSWATSGDVKAGSLDYLMLLLLMACGFGFWSIKTKK